MRGKESTGTFVVNQTFDCEGFSASTKERLGCDILWGKPGVCCDSTGRLLR